MKRYNQTTSYSVAHFILVFLVVCACIVGVIWLLIAAGYRHYERSVADDTAAVVESETVVTSNASPCAQQVMNDVAQMWAYSPNDVPQKYWDMAVNYLNQPVDAWTEDTCNGIRFICNPGQIRRECDPCAVSSAMSTAMEAHARDMISQNCSNN